MNEDELRALIRHAVETHLGGAGSGGAAIGGAAIGGLTPAATSVSLSFGQYRLERAADDTMCLIEPAVRCNHCGFCKCHGH